MLSCIFGSAYSVKCSVLILWWCEKANRMHGTVSTFEVMTCCCLVLSLQTRFNSHFPPLALGSEDSKIHQLCEAALMFLGQLSIVQNTSYSVFMTGQFMFSNCSLAKNLKSSWKAHVSVAEFHLQSLLHFDSSSVLPNSNCVSSSRVYLNKMTRSIPALNSGTKARLFLATKSTSVSPPHIITLLNN